MADLRVFRSRERIEQVRKAAEPRYERRLSDQIATAFYEACRIGNLDAAEHLMRALEWEVARSTVLSTADQRDDGDDAAAVRARYELEIGKRRREAATRPDG